MIQRCKQLLLQLRSADPSASADLSEQTLLKLEVACLAHGEASALQSCVQSVLQRSEPFSLYLELFYLLQQQHCALPEPKKECLRRALQMLIQQPAYALDSVLEIIHGLIEISESRREEFHWAEQLLQIAKMRAEPSLTDMYRRGAGFTARLQEEFSYVVPSQLSFTPATHCSDYIMKTEDNAYIVHNEDGSGMMDFNHTILVSEEVYHGTPFRAS